MFLGYIHNVVASLKAAILDPYQLFSNKKEAM